MSNPPQTILAIHNYYRERGGEDQVFENETGMLERRGHTVIRHSVRNDSISGSGGATLAARAVWNRESYRTISDLVTQYSPDISHFHNSLPLISPSAHHAAAAAGVPVVQTLHNFRLLCPNGLFFRAGAVCEDCLGRRIQWPGIIHKCYRNSLSASATVAAMNLAHGALKTWTETTDAFITLSMHSRERFVTGGLPEYRLHIKPNFMPSTTAVPALAETATGKVGALFVGRLSQEKGIELLVKSWRHEFGLLNVLGDGPLRQKLQKVAINSVRFHGRQEIGNVISAMRKARVLIFPSQWYENMSQVLVEALSAGLPVLASHIGGVPEVIEDGINGRLFAPGDGADLASKLSELLSDDDALNAMGIAGRARFDRLYSEDANYRSLMEIYAAATDRALSRRSR